MENDQASVWVQPEVVPELTPNEVQVWRVATGAVDTRLAASCALLNTEELQRMERIRAGLPRDEFVLGRGCLRALLGRVLQQPPQEILLEVGPHGKPRIADGPQSSGSGIEFNVAHSRGTILIALCRSAAVGVDVEWVDPRIEALEIAEKNFAPGEVALVAAAPKFGKTLEFCRIWAKKEALVKAHGQGLTIGLTGFDVSGDSNVPVNLSSGETARTYFVKEVPVGDDFAGALAIAGEALPIEMFHLCGKLLNALLQS